MADKDKSLRLDKHFPNGMNYKRLTSTYPNGILVGLHVHNTYQLVYIISGNLSYFVEGREYILKSGDLVLTPPGKDHYLKILTPALYERCVVHFEADLHGLDCFFDLPETVEVVNLRKNPVASALFSRIDYYKENLEEEEFYSLFPLLLREMVCILKICSAPNLQEESNISPLLVKAMDYINTNLFTIKGVEELAQALYISPTYLYYLFRNSLHRSPMRYITDKRLLAAQRLIRSGVSPTDAYKACAFQDYSAFYRSYRAYFGHAPSQDRGVQEDS